MPGGYTLGFGLGQGMLGFKNSLTHYFNPYLAKLHRLRGASVECFYKKGIAGADRAAQVGVDRAAD